jgi:hypothetical protein
MAGMETRDLLGRKGDTFTPSPAYKKLQSTLAADAKLIMQKAQRMYDFATSSREESAPFAIDMFEQIQEIAPYNDADKKIAATHFEGVDTVAPKWRQYR